MKTNGISSANGALPVKEVTVDSVATRWDPQMFIPILRIQGMWLKSLGWKAGTTLVLEIEGNSIRLRSKKEADGSNGERNP